MKQLSLRKYFKKLIQSLIKSKPYYNIEIYKRYTKEKIKTTAKVLRKHRIIYQQVVYSSYSDEDFVYNYIILMIAFNVFRISKSLFQRKLQDIYNA